MISQKFYAITVKITFSSSLSLGVIVFGAKLSSAKLRIANEIEPGKSFSGVALRNQQNKEANIDM